LNPGSTVKVPERGPHSAAPCPPEIPMTTSHQPATDGRTVLPPNHHAAYPGFAGARGLMMALLFAARGRPNARAVAELAAVRTGDHVVDIGCGPGSAVRVAARRGARATGVDPSPVMLTVARLLTLLRRRSIDWRPGAAESIPVADGTATVVWSVHCVHHWDDIDAGLAEVRRVLGPGGRVVAVERQVEPGGVGVASHGWLQEQAEGFAERCRALGFVDVAVGEDHAGDAAWVVRAGTP
jgi:SAM-dependent methyltransferase